LRTGTGTASSVARDQQQRIVARNLVVALLVVSVSWTASAQRSFPIVCRGGGPLYFTYAPFSTFSTQPQIWVDFVRGPRGVGPKWEFRNTLQAGQCSWQDRAIASNEPNRLLLRVSVNDFTISWSGNQVKGLAPPSIARLQRADQYQAFSVYNDGRGNFVVTATLPSK
jgi:hypothetical protein